MYHAIAIKNDKRKAFKKRRLNTNGNTQLIVDVTTDNEACSMLFVESFRKHSE